VAEDLPRLARWLGQAHVFRWWHESPSLEATRGQYLPKIEGTEPTHCLIATWDDVPCGMFQHYMWDSFPDEAPKVRAQPGDAGIDYLIGVLEMTGQGFGPQMIGSFIDQIVLADPAVRGIRADVNAENVRSRRTLEKLGFDLVAGHDFIDQGERHVVYRRGR
jgi:aminoglycoside 6'-N-acetyltransferase